MFYIYISPKSAVYQHFYYVHNTLNSWLFSDTDKGADSSAVIFSLIESAKLNKLDVYGYLIFLLTELPKLGNEPSDDKLLKLLPWAKLPDYWYPPHNTVH